MPHFVSIVWGVLIFLAGGFSLSLLKRYLKYNLVFAFEYSFQNNKCQYLFFFFVLLISFQVFFISIFDVSRFNGSQLSCAYVPLTIIFTMFIDESVGKNKSISSKHGIMRHYLKLQEKYSGKNRVFLIIRLGLREYYAKFSRKQVCSVLHFKYVLYV